VGHWHGQLADTLVVDNCRKCFTDGLVSVRTTYEIHCLLPAPLWLVSPMLPVFSSHVIIMITPGPPVSLPPPPPPRASQSLLRSCISVSLPVFGRLADVVTRLDSDVLGGHAAMKLTWRLHVLHSTLNILSRRWGLGSGAASTTWSVGKAAAFEAGVATAEVKAEAEREARLTTSSSKLAGASCCWVLYAATQRHISLYILALRDKGGGGVC
jgi:hypothetical protein